MIRLVAVTAFAVALSATVARVGAEPAQPGVQATICPSGIPDPAMKPMNR